MDDDRLRAAVSLIRSLSGSASATASASIDDVLRGIEAVDAQLTARRLDEQRLQEIVDTLSSVWPFGLA